MNNCAVILAGGEGTRMKSEKPKVMAELLFKPMLTWVTDAVKKAGIEDILVVTGYKSEVIEEYLDTSIKTVKQEQRLGTGHAVMQAKEFIKNHSGGNVLILNGDAPLIDADTLIQSLSYHTKGKYVQTVVSAKVDNPYGYGRIIRDANGEFCAIVEEASANEEEKKVNEINSGVIWFDCDTLTELLGKITNDNSKGEYYLTDTVKIALAENKKVCAFVTENSDAVLGANSRVQLYELNEKVRMSIIKKHMLEGVSIPTTDGVIISDDTVIGKDTVILPGTIIKRGCTVGSNSVIGPNTVLYETQVGNSTILNCVQAEEAKIGSFANLGPFVHIRPNSVIKDGVHCGNFTEIKNSVIGEDTSVSHLTYVGDSDVGSGVNFGCGVVTVNFNGKEKNRCKIGDDAFIGCNTNLVAPVEIGNRAYTAAGSTITDNVPEDTLAIARQRQVNKVNWVKVKKPYREKKQKRR